MLPSALLRPGPTARPSRTQYGSGPRGRRPENVVLLIPDGFGPAGAALAREYLRHKGDSGTLALDPHHVGSVRTHASDHRITDSAAAATAYATGVKTQNGAVATGPDERPLGTLTEAAKRNGMGTGIVATSRITHATPAAFSAHTPDRNRENEIARQQMEQGLDVLLGGGRQHFRPAAKAGGTREDGQPLIRRAEQNGYHVARTAADLSAHADGRLLGLFADDHMAYEVDRESTDQPSLGTMVSAALDCLLGERSGFLLVVEGSRIDHAAHDNDPATHLREILAFNKAVETILERIDPTTTLLLSVADHETGGLTLGRQHDGETATTWHPEFLSTVSASCEKIAETLGHLKSEHESNGRYEKTVRDTLHRLTGISDLTPDERELLSAEPHATDVATLLNRRAQVGWTTDGHTATDVNLYARGPGRARFTGSHDNTAIGQQVADLLGLDLEAATDRSRALQQG